MALPNIFNKEVSSEVVQRINQLSPDHVPTWGKMNVSQMLAHCNVTYEMVYEEDKHPKPGFFMKLIMKNFVKKIVTSETPFKRSSQTAPPFIITDSRDFEAEKQRLILHIEKTREFGETYFDQKESHSLGKLNKTEWNNMFYKHLDHHLTQFGV